MDIEKYKAIYINTTRRRLAMKQHLCGRWSQQVSARTRQAAGLKVFKNTRTNRVGHYYNLSENSKSLNHK